MRRMGLGRVLISAEIICIIDLNEFIIIYPSLYDGHSHYSAEVLFFCLLGTDMAPQILCL